MKQFNPVQAWLDNVAYAHSKCVNTEKNYRTALRDFYQFIGSTPQQTLKEYEGMTDREFRRKYAQYIRAYVSELSNNGYATNTVSSKITAVKSFFKYSDLPLGYVPLAKNKVAFHNRDIQKDEIVEILRISTPRDRAFFCMMAQSGSRPDTLCSLRKKHIEPEFSEGTIPCKIEVPQELAKGEYGAFFSFMGDESVKYLQAYLRTRPSIGPGDYLFTSHGTDKPLNVKSISNIFTRTIEKLREAGIVDFEQIKEGKPRSVRLYNLRKFFRKQGGKAGVEYVNFWMGHKTNYKAPHIPASDVHYFSREDVEFQRQLYKDEAMPFLRLESATPSETDRIIQRQAEEIEKLKARLDGLLLSSDQIQQLLKRIEKLEKQAQKRE